MRQFLKEHFSLFSGLLVVCLTLHALMGYQMPVIETAFGETQSTAEQTNDEAAKLQEVETETESEMTAKGSFDLADAVYTGTGTGYAGSITVSVTIKDKTITDITVTNVEADDEAFFNRAKGVIDLILKQQSLDVDVVSGATYSSNGIIGAVKNALTGEKDTGTVAAGSQKSSATAPTVSTVTESGSYKDGTYTGTGTGFNGTIKVSVTIKDSKIASIKVVSTGDDAAYFNRAKTLLDKIVSKQTTNVDTVSGATYSSAGLIQAVRSALAKAAASSSESGNQDNQETDQTETEVQIPQGTVNLPDGVYYGTAEGFNGDLTVAVAIEEKTIKYIMLTKNEGDDEAFLNRAKAVIDQVLQTQTTENVDTVSGATWSSKGILNAIKDALTVKNEPGETETTETETTESESQTPDTNVPSTGESESETIETEAPETEAKVYADGEYTVSTTCHPDDDEDFEAYTLTATVVIKDDKISDIKNVKGTGSNYDTSNDSYISRALNGTSSKKGVLAQIAGSTNVDGIDTVSRATCSSSALITLCREALSQAKIK